MVSLLFSAVLIDDRQKMVYSSQEKACSVSRMLLLLPEENQEELLSKALNVWIWTLGGR